VWNIFICSQHYSIRGFLNAVMGDHEPLNEGCARLD
jgi:hypothetical protein